MVASTSTTNGTTIFVVTPRNSFHLFPWYNLLKQVNIHAILLEELEEESKHWVTTAEDITTKVTDDIWEVPGNNSAGGQLSMPDDHLWRFSVDIGIYDQEEEVTCTYRWVP